MADNALVKKLRLLPRQQPLTQRALILNPPAGFLERLQFFPESCVLQAAAYAGIG